MPFLSAPAIVLYLLGLLGPLIAALVVTGLCEGRLEVRALLARALRWRFHPLWYAVALFYTGAILFAAQGLVLLSGGSAPPSVFNLQPLLVVWGLVQIWIVIGEEFGWRGFALPRLQCRIGPLGAGLALGVLWASWHLPMFFVPGSLQYGAPFVGYVLTITGHSLVLTLLFNRTGGSVLACMLFHAANNIWVVALAPLAQEFLPFLLASLPVLLFVVALLPRPWLLLVKLVSWQA